MAILFTAPYQIFTANQTLIGDNQTACTWLFKIRYEAAGMTTIGQQLNLVHSDDNARFYSLANVTTPPSGPTPGVVGALYRLYMHDGSHVDGTIPTNTGTINFIAMTHDAVAGKQILYSNGIVTDNSGNPNPIGTSTQATATGSAGFGFGWNGAGSSLECTIDDIIVVNGYAATQTDILNWLFGTAASTVFSGKGTAFFEWTLTGTPGNTVQLGDAGIACSDGIHNFTAKSGSGSLVYANSLTYTINTKLAAAKVLTSGKTLQCVFANVATGALAKAAISITLPTLFRGATNLGQLSRPWVTGAHNCINYDPPAGVTIHGNDSLTLSAPLGWVMCDSGPMPAVSNFPLSNYIGKSAYGSDTLVKTLKPGMNFSELGWDRSAPYALCKNLRYRLGPGSSMGTFGPGFWPLTITGGSQTLYIFNAEGGNGVDNTAYPSLPPGYYLIMADIPRSSTANITMSAQSGAPNTTITEITALHTLGDSNGVGWARVFNVQYSANPTSASLDVAVNFTTSDGGNAFPVTNLWIVGPGDFTYNLIPNTVALDRSNPFALSALTMSRYPYGLGSARWMDGMWNFAGVSAVGEPEYLRSGTDFCGGDLNQRLTNTLSLTTAQPWSAATSAWLYSDNLGSAFNVTLSGNITTTPAAGTQETYGFSWSTSGLSIGTNDVPIMYGLKFTMPSGEICRIISVTPLGGSAANVLLERGSEMTTPRTQVAGTVSCNNRIAINTTAFGKWPIFEVVCSSPHKMRCGAPVALTHWPTFTFNDTNGPGGTGGNVTRQYSGGWQAYCTEASRFLVIWNLGQINYTGTLPVTITTSYDLTVGSPPPAAVFKMIDTQGMSGDFLGYFVNQFPGCICHLNIPYNVNNSCAIALIKKVLSQLTPSHDLVLEPWNEPWNSVGIYYGCATTFSAILASGGGFGLEWYVDRGGQFLTLAHSVANSLGWEGKISLALNCNRGIPSLGQSYLSRAQANGTKVDYLMTSDYWNVDGSNATQQWVWGSTDEQICDLYSADEWYNVAQNALMAAHRASCAAYNLATNNNCQLYGYETGVTYPIPPSPTVTLTAQCLSTDTTVKLSTVACFVAGQYILVEFNTGDTVNRVPIANSELMQISPSWDGVTNPVPVTRGMSGLPLVTVQTVLHANGVNVRSLTEERNNDIINNPQFRQVCFDEIARWQLWGVVGTNYYTSSRNASGQAQWSRWRYAYQPSGRGDGSDGQKDNRLTKVTPPNNKPANVNQPLNTVSPAGQAFLDWMQAVAPIKKKRSMATKPRFRR